jgi:hypothetical protein
METNKLKIINKTLIQYNNKVYDLSKHDDKTLPFQSEATAQENEIANKFWAFKNKLNEDFNNELKGITYNYKQENGITYQKIILDNKLIGYINYNDKGKIDSTQIKYDYRGKNVYPNAIIDYIRKFNRPVISNERNNLSHRIWSNFKSQIPNDLKLTEIDDDDNQYYKTFILSPKNYNIDNLISEDLKPKLNNITYKYQRIGPLISQDILFGGKEIGYIEYQGKDYYNIFQTKIDSDFRRQGIYTNALIDLIRKTKKPIVSDKRNDNSNAVWHNLKSNLPSDMELSNLNDGKLILMLKKK